MGVVRDSVRQMGAGLVLWGRREKMEKHWEEGVAAMSIWSWVRPGPSRESVCGG